LPETSCQLPESSKTVGRSYKDLVAWQKSMDLVAAIYRATRDFPKDEQFGITSQLRRAAVSIPSNIAEGQGRLSQKEFRYFFGQSRGSLANGGRNPTTNCAESRVLGIRKDQRVVEIMR
jgi:hypothetical protein